MGDVACGVCVVSRASTARAKGSALLLTTPYSRARSEVSSEVMTYNFQTRKPLSSSSLLGAMGPPVSGTTLPPPALRATWSALLRRLPQPIGNLLRVEARHADGLVSESARRVLAYDQKLPTGLPPPADEFKNFDPDATLAHTFASSTTAQRFVRVSASMYESIELRLAVTGLATSVFAVYGIGFAESLAILSGDFCSEHPLHAARFAHQYAFEQSTRAARFEPPTHVCHHVRVLDSVRVTSTALRLLPLAVCVLRQSCHPPSAIPRSHPPPSPSSSASTPQLPSQSLSDLRACFHTTTPTHARRRTQH